MYDFQPRATNNQVNAVKLYFLLSKPNLYIKLQAFAYHSKCFMLGVSNVAHVTCHRFSAPVRPTLQYSSM